MEYTYQFVIDFYTQEIRTDGIRRLPDNAWVPNDLENLDWKAYQEWLNNGNNPLQADV